MKAKRHWPDPDFSRRAEGLLCLLLLPLAAWLAAAGLALLFQESPYELPTRPPCR